MLKKEALSSNVVNVSFLIEQLSGNLEDISMMISIFLDQSEEKITALKESVQNKNFKEIKSIAHFLKSSFTIMGLSSKDLLSEIEKLGAMEKDLEKINQLCNIVFKDHAESTIEYKKILSKINTLTDK